MKTKQISIILLCLLFLVIAGQSGIMRAQESPKMQQDRERHKNIARSFWNGGGASISTETLLRDPEFRAALGVSDKYYQEIQVSVRNAVGRLEDNPEYQEVMRESEETRQMLYKALGIPLNAITPMLDLRNPNEETLKALDKGQEVGDRIRLMQREWSVGASQRHSTAWEEAITPELDQKVQESWLAAIGETSTFSPRLFETLNLTDVQKEGLERIKKELEPELEKHLETYSRNAALILERVNAALRQPEVQREIADIGLKAWSRKLEAEPGYKKLLDESYASSKAFATLFRMRMSEILNDEQRRRLQGLIDNPPPYARLLIQRLRRENWGQYQVGAGDLSVTNRRADSDEDMRLPGPDSWKPGDPIPEGYRQQRQERGRFPRVNQSE